MHTSILQLTEIIFLIAFSLSSVSKVTSVFFQRAFNFPFKFCLVFIQDLDLERSVQNPTKAGF